MNKVKSYRDIEQTEDVITANQWLSKETYDEVVQKMVITCTDVVFCVEGDQAIYLGKRVALPMAGLWVFGGRMLFNDASPEEAIARCVKVETGILIDSERFQYVTTNFYSWTKVAQGSFPGKSIGMTYQCVVTKEEINELAQGLSETEYDKEFGIQRFDRARLIEENAHPAMLDLYNQIFNK